MTVPASKAGAESAKAYQFHGVLPPACKQADVLRACGITQLLDAALAGVACCLWGCHHNASLALQIAHNERHAAVGGSDQALTGQLAAQCSA